MQPAMPFKFRVRAVHKPKASQERLSDWSSEVETRTQDSISWTDRALETRGGSILRNGFYATRDVKSLAMAPEHTTQLICFEAEKGFRTGVHQWELKLNHIHQSVVNIGLAMKSTSRLGSHPSSISFCSVQTKNPLSGRASSTSLRSRDVWMLEVDCERRLLSAWMNGDSVGYVRELPPFQAKDDSYIPAVYIREPDDGLTLIPRPPPGLHIASHVEALHRWVAALRDVEARPIPNELLYDSYMRWKEWTAKDYRATLWATGYKLQFASPNKQKKPPRRKRRQRKTLKSIWEPISTAVDLNGCLKAPLAVLAVPLVVLAVPSVAWVEPLVVVSVLLQVLAWEVLPLEENWMKKLSLLKPLPQALQKAKETLPPLSHSQL